MTSGVYRYYNQELDRIDLRSERTITVNSQELELYMTAFVSVPRALEMSKLGLWETVNYMWRELAKVEEWERSQEYT